MHEELERERKKVEGSKIDPLNLPINNKSNLNNNKYVSIYECLEKVDDEISFQIKKCNNIKDSKSITKKMEELRLKSERDRASKINRGVLVIAN